MQINLYDNTDVNTEINVGDIIVYYNPEYDDYDYFMIIEKFGTQHTYRLLRLKDDTVVTKCFNCMCDLIEHGKQPINGYHLHEIIPSEELELRRIK